MDNKQFVQNVKRLIKKKCVLSIIIILVICSISHKNIAHTWVLVKLYFFFFRKPIFKGFFKKLSIIVKLC